MEYKLTLYIDSNKTRQDLLNDIEYAWEEVKEYEETLKLYSIANPKDITPTDLNPVGYLQKEVGDYLELYRDAVLNWRRALDFLDAYDDYQEEYKRKTNTV